MTGLAIILGGGARPINAASSAQKSDDRLLRGGLVDLLKTPHNDG
jgi:hypothetical protein